MAHEMTKGLDSGVKIVCILRNTRSLKLSPSSTYESDSSKNNRFSIIPSNWEIICLFKSSARRTLTSSSKNWDLSSILMVLPVRALLMYVLR